MLKASNEIRMIWLLVLIIIGAGFWFLELEKATYVCGIVFIVSAMQYINSFSQSISQLSSETKVITYTPSKVPLYISSIVVVISAILNWTYLVVIGISVWVYFLLQWLNYLEQSIQSIQSLFQERVSPQQIVPHDLNEYTENEIKENEAQQGAVSNSINSILVESGSTLNQPATHERVEQTSNGFIEQIQLWIFKGNPVLKVAIGILLIGIVLLLRFATEHWQFSLAVKLATVSIVSLGVVLVGILIQAKQRSFALALEGLGLAGLFLTLFFAYYNLVIPNIYGASLAFVAVMALTLYLSLKQQSVELAIMAMAVAYVAPFTLPIRQATSVELLSYYFIINIAVAILSTLRPWKFLNQIAFLMTVLLGGGYTVHYAIPEQRLELTYLIFAHTAIFVWLGFRFSQLLAKESLIKIQLKPILDLVLIFGAPIVSYLALYVMYFNEMYWRVGFSAIFALVFAVLYQLAKRNKSIPFIAQSYLSLMQIFLALIPPTLLPEYWNVVGWSVEGLLILIYALYRNSDVSRYLGMGLLLIAGISSIQCFIHYNDIPNSILWTLCICYFASVFITNFNVQFQKQFNVFLIAFLSFLMISATSLLLILLQDELHGANVLIHTLLFSLIFYVFLNEILQRRNVSWGWLLPKWLGLIPIHLFAYSLVYSRAENGILQWESGYERILVLCAGVLLVSLWLRPLLGLKAEREWVCMGALGGLSLASLSLVPQFPYLSVVILPLSFCLWCYWRKDGSEWTMFWQSKTALILMVVWIVCSQLFATQIFQFYWLPVLNPFDLVSIAMLVGFMWTLLLQVKVGLDKGLAAIMAVLSLLWLSSYILLRALHVYLNTPIHQLEVWSNSIIQLSFTLLWVVLAFIAMSIATKKHLKTLWVLGGSILCIVTLKLVLLDLSHTGTLMRVISFLGAGFIMLIIAYIAPMPTEEIGEGH